MIYLDNAATTYPKPESVYIKMDWANRNLAFNAGRGSYDVAKQATHFIDDTRKRLLDLVGACGNEKAILTNSATEALNIILKGIMWNHNDVVYVSPYEHNAVARTLELIRQQYDIHIELLPLKNETLEIDIERITYLFAKDKPKCVCCTHVSNVTGYILPIKEIFDIGKQFGAVTVLDASQSLGLVAIDINHINADFIAFAGHKTPYGPFGVGGFIDACTYDLNISSAGGTGSDSLNLKMPSKSPEKYEFGSKNIVSIIGLNQALTSLNQEMVFKHETELLRYLVEKLEKIPGVVMYISGKMDDYVGILSLNVKGYKADEVGNILDADYGISVRTGYHCAPFIHDFLKDKEYLGTVRIGISQFTSKQDLDVLCCALEELS